MALQPYQIYHPDGHLVLDTSESVRYSRALELDMLEAGYIIKLNGKRLTKAELRKEVKRK